MRPLCALALLTLPAACTPSLTVLPGREIGDQLRGADRIVVITALPPRFRPPQAPSMSGGASALPVLGAAALAADHLKQNERAGSQGKESPQPVRLDPSLGTVTKSLVSFLRDDLHVPGAIDEALTASVRSPQFPEFVQDIRKRKFPDMPLIAVQLNDWTLLWWRNDLYRVRYTASAKIYLPQHELPIWWKDCLVLGGSDGELAATLDTYVSNDAALLNRQIRAAAEQCGTELARELKNLHSGGV